MSQKAKIAAVLWSHGDMFAGNHPEDAAEEWIDQDFDAPAVDAWCDAGVWDVATAAILRDAGITPEMLKQWAEDNPIDPADTNWQENDPIYAACNGDLDTSILISKVLGLD